jgi:hypothetical protein
VTTENYGYTPTSYINKIENTFSFSFWAKITQHFTSSAFFIVVPPSNSAGIVSRFSGTAAQFSITSYNQYPYGWDMQDRMRASFDHPSNKPLNYTDLSSTFHHYTFAMNSTFATFYVDGKQTILYDFSDIPFKNRLNYVYFAGWGGTYDDITVYNNVFITPSQVGDLYLKGVDYVCTKTPCYYSIPKYYTNENGTCVVCESGYYCPGGVVKFKCPVNFYCPSMSTAPSMCPFGMVSLESSTQVSDCLCPVGKVSDTTADHYKPSIVYVNQSSRLYWNVLRACGIAQNQSCKVWNSNQCSGAGSCTNLNDGNEDLYLTLSAAPYYVRYNLERNRTLIGGRLYPSTFCYTAGSTNCELRTGNISVYVGQNSTSMYDNQLCYSFSSSNFAGLFKYSIPFDMNCTGQYVWFTSKLKGTILYIQELELISDICTYLPTTVDVNNVEIQPNVSASICPAGYYCPTGTVDVIPCPAGTYNEFVNSTDLSFCLICPQGTYGPKIGSPLNMSASCLNCPTGYYQNHTGAGNFSDCKLCPLGSYATLGGMEGGHNDASDICHVCPNNSYCPNQTSIKTCPEHTSTVADGSYTILSCRCYLGFYCTYNKRIFVDVTLLATTVSDFNDDVNGIRTSFINIIAEAAHVSPGDVTITKVVNLHAEGARRRSLSSQNTRKMIRVHAVIRNADRIDSMKLNSHALHHSHVWEEAHHVQVARDV